MPKIKVKGRTVQTGEHPQTNGLTHTRTHTDATKRIISPAMHAVDKNPAILLHAIAGSLSLWCMLENESKLLQPMALHATYIKAAWALCAGSLCWHASQRESPVLVLLVPLGENI